MYKDEIQMKVGTWVSPPFSEFVAAPPHLHIMSTKVLTVNINDWTKY